MSKKRTLRRNIFLIGDVDSQIHGNKLPSQLQVLRHLFFNLRELKLTLWESALLVIKEVTIFWEKARLPIQHSSRCVEKLKALYHKWRNVQKRAGKACNIEKEKNFRSKLNNLFDIAHGNILKMIDDGRKEFLLNQRKDGRIGCIVKMNEADEEFRSREGDIVLQRLKKTRTNGESSMEIAECSTSDEISLNTQSRKSVSARSNFSVVDTDSFAVVDDELGSASSEPKKLRAIGDILDVKLVTVSEKHKLRMFRRNPSKT